MRKSKKQEEHQEQTKGNPEYEHFVGSMKSMALDQTRRRPRDCQRIKEGRARTTTTKRIQVERMPVSDDGTPVFSHSALTHQVYNCHKKTEEKMRAAVEVEWKSRNPQKRKLSSSDQAMIDQLVRDQIYYNDPVEYNAWTLQYIGVAIVTLLTTKQEGKHPGFKEFMETLNKLYPTGFRNFTPETRKKVIKRLYMAYDSVHG